MRALAKKEITAVCGASCEIGVRLFIGGSADSCSLVSGAYNITVYSGTGDHCGVVTYNREWDNNLMLWNKTWIYPQSYQYKVPFGYVAWIAGMNDIFGGCQLSIDMLQ